MASQCVVILSLFLVLVGTTMAQPTGPPGPREAEIHTIDYYNNEEVQFLGRYAVDVNNNKSKSHLFFKQVVNGTVIRLPSFYTHQRMWYLQLMAINCSESGSPSKYLVQLFENVFFFGNFGNRIEAYGSTFIARDEIARIN